MDDSVELFKAEQKRIADAGGLGGYFRQHLISNFLTLMTFSLCFWATMSFLDLFPRNPDNSMKLAVTGPATAAAATIASLVLKIAKPKAQAIRWTCWGFIAFALVIISTGALDLLSKPVP